MVARGARELMERDAEIGLIGDWISRAREEEGGLLVVEGHAGVGKTELLCATGELGVGRGMRVLRGRGSELDRTFSFVVVRQLFERAVAADPSLLSRGAEAARAVFASEAPELSGREIFGSLQGLYWLVVNLAAERPLILIADDIHWADDESLRWLVFLAQRLEGLAVLLVVATRPADPGANQDLLDMLLTTPGAGLVRPSPLSAGATRKLVEAVIPGAAEVFGDACHRATGGNPFLVGELLGELIADGVRGSAGDASLVLEFGSERVGRAIRQRLRRLPAVATGLARAVAVLGPQSTLADAAALAGCSEAAASQAAGALVELEVLAAEPVLDFVHPVVRGAVYEQIPPLERQTLHAAAAERLAGRGADSERVARHLLRLTPAQAPARAQILRAAARVASARGAAAAAARYLRRALEEITGGPERGAILHELGVAEATDRQRGRFARPLREAMALAPDSETRGRVALDLGRALAGSGDFRASAEVLGEALEQLSDTDENLGVVLEAELLAMTFHEFTIDERTARWERRFAQLAAGEKLAAPTLACLVLAMATSRPPASVAIALGEEILSQPALRQRNSVVAGMLGNGLIYAGAAASAGRFFDGMIATAAEHGNRLDAGWLHLLRSEASLRLGEIRRAETEAWRGRELVAEGGDAHAIAWSAANVVSALVARGALSEAEAFLAEDPGFHAPPSFPLALVLTARAELHLTQGRARAALQDAQAAGELLPSTISNPWCCRWPSPAALALAGLGRGEEARAQAGSELAAARRFGIPEAEGAALRTLGLVTNGGDGLESLRASVALLERGDARLEHARSLLELGAALRRAGQRAEAREVLREALDATARTGASGLADRAHQELVAAGAHPRHGRRLLSGRESLTVREDHVAVLAATGLTNREIAQRDFVTVKAVEWHLSNVYRKLDVSSRRDLAAALDAGPQDETLGPSAQRHRRPASA
jgi:DNA-binding CsgD family transcriptional regulator